MGNYTVDSASTLKFIDNIQDPHFGQIDIFRTEDAKFVMRMKRTHIIGDIRHAFFKKAVEWVQSEPCQFVVPIMHIHNQVERGLCIQFEASEIYSEYYNFTFLDLLLTKKELEQAELWFILQTLLTLSTTLRKNKLAINFKINNIFITLKGIPCVYFHHFLPLEESIIYSQHSMGQQISIILMQLCTGQQIQEIQENESKSLLLVMSKVCARYKLLGRAIKQLLNREKNEEEMLDEIANLFQSAKINKFNEIKLNKFRYALPDQSSQKSSQKQLNQPPKKRAVNNSPITFKPKKQSEDRKESFVKSKQMYKDQQTQTHGDDDFKLKQLQLKKKLNEMIPKKQETQKLFDQLLKRKEECKAKMDKIANKKEEFISEGEKENRQFKAASRKNSQPKKGRQRRFTQISKNSNYR